MGKLTVAKFIPMTSIIPDSATAVSLTFLPDGIIVEAAWECSESFGWVQDKLREPGLRGPYGVGSAQGSAHWVTPFLILILSLEFECLSPFLQNTLGTRGSLILNKAGKQRSAAFGMFSSRSSHSEASSRRRPSLLSPLHYATARAAPKLSRLFCPTTGKIYIF